MGGSSVIERILRAVEPLTTEQVLLTNDASLADLGRGRLIFDPNPHAGVLPALEAGLAQASYELCIAVACDMPFVSSRLLELLLALQIETDADVVIPRNGPNLEPMHALYRATSVRSAIGKALARGEQRMISYFADVRVREVQEAEWREADPAGLAFFNINTPEELARARELVTSLDRSAASETA